MAARSEHLLQYIHRLASQANSASDATLLNRFLQSHDEAAFAALVDRHGPMVLGVCRRILGDASDAEDAFQATFLTLARKAAAIHPANSLPAWLYGVARHLALRIRRSRDRRRRREAAGGRRTDARPQQNLLDQLSGREVLEIVDEEIQRLPEVYRLPLILCYLEGHGHDEAARRLGWSLGSFRGRLERGRQRLQARLVRRGLTLGTTLLLWDLLRRGTAAAVAPALAQATVRSAVSLAASQGVVLGGILSQAAALTEGIAKASFATKMRMAAVLLAVGVAAAMSGALVHPARPAPADQPKPAAETPIIPEKSTRRTDRFGDPLPAGALARLGTVRWRQAMSMQMLAFTRDGKGLIAAGMGGPVRLWDRDTGRMLRSFGKGADAQVSAAALSPDGRILAGRGAGGLCLWNMATGTLLRRLKEAPTTNPFPLPLAFSPDGKTVASVDGVTTLRLWETATGKERWAVNLWAKHQQRVTALTYSADGKTLIWADFRECLHVWDAAAGKELQSWNDRSKIFGFVPTLAASPDGRLFAAYGPRGMPGGLARLLDGTTGKEIWQLAGAEGKSISTAAFSPDGKILATGCLRGSLRLWDAATGKELRRCDGYLSAQCLAFAPDGKTLAAADQTIRLWDVGSGREIRRAGDGHETAVGSAAFTPDGQDIVSRSWDGSLRVWDAATGEQRRQLLPADDDVHFLAGTSAVSADGKSLFSATMDRIEQKSHLKVRLWDRASGRERHHWSQEFDRGFYHPPICSADGKIATCLNSQFFHLWEAATGKELPKIAGTSSAFSSDGKLLATIPWRTHDGFILWEAATAKKLGAMPVPEGYMQRLLFSPDGRRLATVSYQARPNVTRIHLWPLFQDESAVRVGSPRLLMEKRGGSDRPTIPPGANPAAMIHAPSRELFRAWAFSPDGRTLALAGEDGTVRLVETASGRERSRFAGHSGAIEVLSFAPDGRRLTSGSLDTTLLVWDVTGRLQRGRLRAAQLSAEELQRLWTDLAADDAEQAGRAIWMLASDPIRAMPYLAERLRTFAADAAKALAKVPQLVRDLDASDFTVREKARAELTRLGEAAEPALRQALAKSPPLETRRSLEQLLQVLATKRQTLSGKSRRGVRALEVLEQIGNGEARAALKAVTAGAALETPLTQEAHAALKRLDRPERR